MAEPVLFSADSLSDQPVDRYLRDVGLILLPELASSIRFRVAPPGRVIVRPHEFQTRQRAGAAPVGSYRWVPILVQGVLEERCWTIVSTSRA